MVVAAPVALRAFRIGRALAVATLLTLHSAAEDAPSSPAGTGPTLAEPTASLELQVVGSEAEASALKQALGTHHLFATRLRWSTADSFHPRELLRISRVHKQLPRGSTIVCWIDLRDHAIARLYFVDPVHDRFMLRELTLEQALDSFEAETIAQIVELSAFALASDAAAGMSRNEAQAALAETRPEVVPQRPVEPEPAAVAIPSSTPVYACEVAAAYVIRGYSTEIPWVTGPALAVALTRSNGIHQGRLELSSGYEIPRSFASEIGQAKLSAWTWRLRAESLFSVSQTARLWLGANFAAGFDIVRATASAGTAQGDYQFSNPRIDTPLVLSPGISWLAELSDRLATRLLLALDVTPKPIVHTMTVDGTSVVLTEAHRLRPNVSLGLVLH